MRNESRRVFLSDVSALARRIRLENQGDDYVAFHAHRFATLLELLSTYTESRASVLDIGRSKLTDVLSETFGVQVDSLGLEPDHQTNTGHHHHMDLNDVQFRERWRKDMTRYDVVVMAEVIEHLHTSPSLVLEFIRGLMKHNAVLIIQTPNAVALHNRLIMLCGRNPFELIREGIADPGHFREYTLRELKRYADQAGLVVEKCFFDNYFDYRYLKRDGPWLEYGALLNLVYKIVPRQLRPGITLVLRST